VGIEIRFRAYGDRSRRIIIIKKLPVSFYISLHRECHRDEVRSAFAFLRHSAIDLNINDVSRNQSLLTHNSPSVASPFGCFVFLPFQPIFDGDNPCTHCTGFDRLFHLSIREWHSSCSTGSLSAIRCTLDPSKYGSYQSGAPHRLPYNLNFSCDGILRNADLERLGDVIG
jgi:hypothetical protein